MKIYTTEKIREADQYTLKSDKITSPALMERAAKACSDWISAECKNTKKFAVFCGSGNNGGDGFALARMLYENGFEVKVYYEFSKIKRSDDAEQNLKKLRKISEITHADLKDIFISEPESSTVIIDALLGTGFSGKMRPDLSKIVKKMNTLKSVKISVDIPTGLSADGISENDDQVFKADYTLSFQFWKRSFLHSESGKFCGKVIILDIQLSEKFISENDSDFYSVDENMIQNIFRRRDDFGNKGTFGKAMIVAGSYGKIGAAVLSTQSALKSGAGLVITAAPECGYGILQTACPEAMFVSTGSKNMEHFDDEKEAVFGIGPGLGIEQSTADSLADFLKNHHKPVVLDADALNIIAGMKDGLKLIPKNSVITPHPKEFERLFGKTESSFERLELARKMSEKYKVYIILKDHHTQIITPEKIVFYNITGNSGLAKGGSGDILTGIITSLLAQKYSPQDAAVYAVWLHGTAADLAAEKYSKESMQPSDVIAEFGSVFKKLNSKTSVDF